MIWDVVFLLAVGFAAVAYSVFVVAYGSAFRWERTGEGRSLMAVSSAQAVLAWVYVLRRIDEITPAFSLAGTTLMNGLLTAAWAVAGSVAAWRCAGLVRRDKGDD